MQTPSSRKWRVSVALVKKRKAALRQLNKTMTLREIANKLFDNEITFQTLGRFVKEKKYTPKDYRACEVLGIIQPINPYRNLPRWYQRTPEALAYFNGKREQIKAMFTEAKRQAQEWKSVQST